MTESATNYHYILNHMLSPSKANAQATSAKAVTSQIYASEFLRTTASADFCFDDLSIHATLQQMRNALGQLLCNGALPSCNSKSMP